MSARGVDVTTRVRRCVIAAVGLLLGACGSAPTIEELPELLHGAPTTNGASSNVSEPPVAAEARAPQDEVAGAPAGGGRARDATSAAPETSEPDADATGDVMISRGAELLAILIPRSEELVFDVEVDLGIAGDVTAGKVTLSSGAEPYVEGLPPRGAAPKKSGKEVGWIKSVAEGSHLGYVLHHELYVRHLPQQMPRILYQDTQSGSENRRRKLKIGVQDGGLVCVYDHDGHCKGCTNREHYVESKWPWGDPHHCDKCKRPEHRAWKDPVSRTIPAGSVDMLSAVYLARSIVRDGRENTVFSLIDKQRVWNVELRRGRRARIEVPAGRFECVEIQLLTSLPPGEKDDGSRFEGLFGIHGKIQIWFEQATGVPVLIAGSLPVPVVGELDVRVQLKSANGTPAAFVPLR
jgi:hypothetical protein